MPRVSNMKTKGTCMNATAEIIISIVPIVGIGIGGVVVFFSLLWHHHEVKQQIEKGIYRKEKFNLRAYSFLIGLILTGVGLMLSLFFAVANGFSTSMLGGLIPFAIGVCLIIFYKLNEWEN